MYKYKFNIHAFDGEGGAAAAGSEGAGPGENSQAAAGTEVQGNSPNGMTDTASGTDISFDDYVKQHKDEATKWFQKQFNARHRDYNQLKERADASNTILDMLATKFGIQDRNDIAAITQALENDDYLYAERAEANNRSIEEQRNWDLMERENRQFRETQKQMQAQQNMQRQLAEWEQQSNNLKQIFPNFNLDNELQNPEFTQMLQNGMSMERAFYAIHGEEITTGAMQYTAQAVRQATAEDIAARKTRPRENGLASNAAAKVSKDVHNLTKAERAALAAQSLKGQPIRF